MIWIVMLAAAFAGAGGPEQPAQELAVPSVLLKPVEEAQVAARESGAIAAVETRCGQTVEKDQTLALIDDAESQLVRERVAIELEIAQERAGNDVGIRHARKTLAVAQAELDRATAAVEKYPQSISDREMARLRLTVERDTLAVEQSEHEHRIAQAELRAKLNALQSAALRLARRQVTAPFAGIVAEVARARGEWVEPGDTVVRLVRMDRLRAEGFVDARRADSGLVGCLVQLSVQGGGDPPHTFPGKVVFVSPEMDPVNGQVLVWAEVENPDLVLRPGLKAAMTIVVARPPASP